MSSTSLSVTAARAIATTEHPSALPLLPRNYEEMTRGMTDQQRDQIRKEMRKQFTKTKAQFMGWVRKDRDPRMNGTAKLIIGYLVDCLNFETGLCFPSHETIADEIGKSAQTVERTIPRIIEAGWISIRRVRRNAPTFYRFHAPAEKVKRIEECAVALKENREARRDERRYPKQIEHQPTDEQIAEFLKTTQTSGRPQFEPTLLTGDDGSSYEEENSTVGMCARNDLNVSASPPLASSSGNRYANARADDPSLFLPIPASEDEANDMVFAMLEGHPAPALLAAFDDLRDLLMSGQLSPAKAWEFLGDLP